MKLTDTNCCLCGFSDGVNGVDRCETSGQLRAKLICPKLKCVHLFNYCYPLSFMNSGSGKLESCTFTIELDDLVLSAHVALPFGYIKAVTTLDRTTTMNLLVLSWSGTPKETLVNHRPAHIHL